MTPLNPEEQPNCSLVNWISKMTELRDKFSREHMNLTYLTKMMTNANLSSIENSSSLTCHGSMQKKTLLDSIKSDMHWTH